MIEALEAIRPFWVQAMQRGFKERLSGRAVLRAGRGAGLRIADRTFWEMWHSVSSWYAYAYSLERLRPETTPPRSWVTEGFDWQTRPFIYQFDIRVREWDEEVGEWVEEWREFAVGSDVLISKGEAVADLEWLAEKYNIDLVDFRLTGVRHRPAAEWKWKGAV